MCIRIKPTYSRDHANQICCVITLQYILMGALAA